MFTPKYRSQASTRLPLLASEKGLLLSALFFLALGVGLIFDGDRLYRRQLKSAQHIDYRATLNPYSP